jgi:hypothetical protein
MLYNYILSWMRCFCLSRRISGSVLRKLRKGLAYNNAPPAFAGGASAFFA